MGLIRSFRPCFRHDRDKVVWPVAENESYVHLLKTHDFRKVLSFFPVVSRSHRSWMGVSPQLLKDPMEAPSEANQDYQLLFGEDA